MFVKLYIESVFKKNMFKVLLNKTFFKFKMEGNIDYIKATTQLLLHMYM